MSPFKKISTVFVVLVFCLLFSSLAMPSWGGGIARTEDEMSPVVVAKPVSFTFHGREELLQERKKLLLPL